MPFDELTKMMISESDEKTTSSEAATDADQRSSDRAPQSASACLYDQVTIREIRIVEQHRNKGLLNGLIWYLLFVEGVEAVQLEAVESPILGPLLISSFLWARAFHHLDDPTPWIGCNFVTHRSFHEPSQIHMFGSY